MRTVIIVFFIFLVVLSIVAVIAMVASLVSRIRRARNKKGRFRPGRNSTGEQMWSHRMLAEYHGGLKEVADHRLGLMFKKGLSLKNKGRFRFAIQAFERCLADNLTPRQHTAILVTTGNCYFAANDLPSARKHFHKASLISMESDDDNAYLSSLINLGIVSAAYNRWEEAIAHYHQAIGLDQKLGHISGEAIDLNTLGLLYENKGDLESALTHYTASHLIFEKLADVEKLRLVENNVQRVRSIGSERKAGR
jgi:tetratricopeptide (TPR) repeat protein